VRIEIIIVKSPVGRVESSPTLVGTTTKERRVRIELLASLEPQTLPVAFL
jgi:hypothetical protein